MLESAEIGHRIAKEIYARDEPALREALLLAQFDLSRTRRGPVLVIVSGVDGAGRSETVNTLTAWMDPRHIRVVAFGRPTPERRHTRARGATGRRCRRRVASGSSCTPGTTIRCARACT